MGCSSKTAKKKEGSVRSADNGECECRCECESSCVCEDEIECESEC